MGVLPLLATQIRSASRKYHETAGNHIRAQAESKLDKPGAPSNMQRVQAGCWQYFLKAYGAMIHALVVTESKNIRKVSV